MMQVEHSSIEFDMCPTCREIWLDRRELEKLMDSVQSQQAASPQQAPESPWGARDREDDYKRHRSHKRKHHDDDDDDDDDDHHHRSGKHHHGKRRGGLFDFFD